MKRNKAAIILGLAITGSAITGAGALYAGATQNAELSFGSQSDTDAADEDSEIEIPNSGAFEMVSLETSDSSSESDSASEAFSYGSVADVAEAAMPSIVAITNKSVQEVSSYFSGRTLQYEAESAGSGIIVGSNDTELLICTNNHVVEDATELTVSFIDDASISAVVKGTDPSNDLAVIAVNLEDIPQETKDVIKIATLNDSDDYRVGEQVVAIGNALGYGQSVTTGIVSAKDRTIGVADEDEGSGYGYGYGYYGYEEEDTSSTYENLIQTDAAINPGNSGGALLNMNGEVIGINSAKASSSGVEGMGYAIPISKAMPILEELMNKTTRTKLDESEMGYIGIRGQSVSTEATRMYGIPSGIYVTTVSEGTPAEAAGLVEGDIITAFDGDSLSSMDDLQARLQYYAAGEEVELTVYSQTSDGYQEKTITVTLGDRSELTAQQ